MQNAGVRERVAKLLEQHGQNERLLDAYWQWATNPTPPAAGYALEENGGFIATNLLIRYGEPSIATVTQLSDECRDLRKDASVYDVQQAVLEVLNGALGQVLRDGVVQRLHDPAPARRFLAAWLVCRARWCFRQGPNAWVAGEFDWSLGTDLEQSPADARTQLARVLFGESVAEADILREAMASGIVNRLFYRSASGRMEPKFRPGPRIPLSAIAYADRT
ncbi:MAG TPA: hypothetical protein VNT75_18300 [Symbiobacteriaceae bacterium]|nr:hypothetical protein [Symbiobacteriaceae bacterium]